MVWIISYKAFLEYDPFQKFTSLVYICIIKKLLVSSFVFWFAHGTPDIICSNFCDYCFNFQLLSSKW